VHYEFDMGAFGCVEKVEKAYWSQLKSSLYNFLIYFLKRNRLKLYLKSLFRKGPSDSFY